MARHRRAVEIEAVARPVVAVGNEYPAGHEHPAHSHRRSQLLFAERGTMLVRTAHGAWMVPPSQGVWIPGGTVHGISMLGQVATRSVYLEPDARPGLATECRVVGIPPLLRELLIAAVDVPAEYDPDGRDGRVMSLLMDEILAAPVLPLSLPLPRGDRLLRRCRRFLERPSMHDTIEAWSRTLALSRRSFTRRFREETGLSFAEWQRRACLLAALPRLLNGERVTAIALDLGYAGPTAFSTMFRRTLGVAPSAYGR
ncbi:AraC family transcriptional regulator [Roseomonas terrae]|uniref:AraC family transcriptional regulator n=1 Tax=Neoroseomonas terrae TaxID=424799 RepID=A0ABS5EE96_9PROT|nr:helix-turn-helix transcriptional regulator [Neoroseomonas terrae]MBR0649344.1 AraC family transcriptional regulator [Neoroseomonas terrae]